MRSIKKRYHFAEMKDQLRLAALLDLIEKADTTHTLDLRTKAVYAALSLALAMGMPGGVKFDPKDLEWPSVFIELPTGQVSWRVPTYDHENDRPTKEVLNERVHQYMQDAAQ